MKLRRHGWLGRFYFWSLRSSVFGDVDARHRADCQEQNISPTNLCQVIGRVGLLVPLRALLYAASAMVATVLVAVVAVSAYQNWITLVGWALWGLAGLGAVAVLGLVATMLSALSPRVHINAREIAEATAAYVRAIKRCHCPLVEWVHSDHPGGEEPC